MAGASSNTKSQRIIMVAALAAVSAVLAVVAWKYSGGQDAFLSGLLKLISIVFFLLAALSVASMVIIGQSSHEQLDKANRRRPRGGNSSSASRPASDAFEFDVPEPATASSSSSNKPQPVSAKQPRPVGKPAAVQKKPRPVRKTSEE